MSENDPIGDIHEQDVLFGDQNARGSLKDLQSQYSSTDGSVKHSDFRIEGIAGIKVTKIALDDTETELGIYTGGSSIIEAPVIFGDSVRFEVLFTTSENPRFVGPGFDQHRKFLPEIYSWIVNAPSSGNLSSKVVSLPTAPGFQQRYTIVHPTPTATQKNYIVSFRFADPYNNHTMETSQQGQLWSSLLPFCKIINNGYTPSSFSIDILNTSATEKVTDNVYCAAEFPVSVTLGPELSAGQVPSYSATYKWLLNGNVKVETAGSDVAVIPGVNEGTNTYTSEILLSGTYEGVDWSYSKLSDPVQNTINAGASTPDELAGTALNWQWGHVDAVNPHNRTRMIATDKLVPSTIKNHEEVLRPSFLYIGGATINGSVVTPNDDLTADHLNKNIFTVKPVTDETTIWQSSADGDTWIDISDISSTLQSGQFVVPGRRGGYAMLRCRDGLCYYRYSSAPDQFNYIRVNDTTSKIYRLGQKVAAKHQGSVVPNEYCKTYGESLYKLVVNTAEHQPGVPRNITWSISYDSGWSPTITVTWDPIPDNSFTVGSGEFQKEFKLETAYRIAIYQWDNQEVAISPESESMTVHGRESNSLTFAAPGLIPGKKYYVAVYSCWRGFDMYNYEKVNKDLDIIPMQEVRNWNWNSKDLITILNCNGVITLDNKTPLGDDAPLVIDVLTEGSNVSPGPIWSRKNDTVNLYPCKNYGSNLTWYGDEAFKAVRDEYNSSGVSIHQANYVRTIMGSDGNYYTVIRSPRDSKSQTLRIKAKQSRVTGYVPTSTPTTSSDTRLDVDGVTVYINTTGFAHDVGVGPTPTLPDGASWTRTSGNNKTVLETVEFTGLSDSQQNCVVIYWSVDYWTSRNGSGNGTLWLYGKDYTTNTDPVATCSMERRYEVCEWKGLIQYDLTFKFSGAMNSSVPEFEHNANGYPSNTGNDGTAEDTQYIFHSQPTQDHYAAKYVRDNFQKYVKLNPYNLLNGQCIEYQLEKINDNENNNLGNRGVFSVTHTENNVVQVSIIDAGCDDSGYDRAHPDAPSNGCADLYHFKIYAIVQENI